MYDFVISLRFLMSKLLKRTSTVYLGVKILKDFQSRIGIPPNPYTWSSPIRTLHETTYVMAVNVNQGV
jgi:hypothetical protein